MLTGYQCEVVAFQTEGDFVCPDCARREYGELSVSRAERGLDTGVALHPMIRYTMDEYQAKTVDDYADGDDTDIDLDDPDTWPPVCCGDCGTELTD